MNKAIASKLRGAGEVSAEVAAHVAPAFAYAAGIALAGRVGRAAELSLRLGTHEPLLGLPFAFGEDLMVVAGVGLLLRALGRVKRTRTFVAVAALLLLPLALLAPADVYAYKLTGAPITWQRLRGDEGATLKDLDLLDNEDLIGGFGGIGLGLIALFLALRARSAPRFVQRWSQVRNLLVTFAVGAAMSFGVSQLLPRSITMSEHPLVALVGSLIEPPELAALQLTDAEWRGLLRSRETKRAAPVPALGGERPKNAIIFLAEGIDYGHTGFAPRFAKAKAKADGKKKAEPNPTPNLVRRQARDGLVFDRYYTNWHASIQALFSVVCSMYPPLNGDIVRIKPRIDCGELSEVMRARGLRTGLFHGGMFNFYDKLALLGRRGYSIERDAAELGQNSKWAKHQWGIDDRAVVESALKWIDSQPKDQGFVALIVPITAHYPYWVPLDFKKPFKNTTRENRFLNAVAFQDHVFEELARGLEQRGLYDDTLLAWLGDHGHYVAEPRRETPGLRGFYDPNLHTPLVLLSSKLFPPTLPANERHTSRLGSHVDLVPTILDALELPAEPRHDGQSLLSPEHEPRRVFFGADDGRFVGFIDERTKVAANTRRKHLELYDLKGDPGEKKNLAGERAQSAERVAQDALLFAGAVRARIEATPVLPEKLSVEQVYELFVENAAVSLKSEDGSVVECGKGSAASCPGIGAPLRIQAGLVQRERRRCVMAHVPERGEIAFDVNHKDTLALLSGTIVALPGAPKSDPRFVVTVTTDGKTGKSVYVNKSSGAVRPGHPRPQKGIRFVLRRKVFVHGGKPELHDEAAELAKARVDAPELCLQLTALYSE